MSHPPPAAAALFAGLLLVLTGSGRAAAPAAPNPMAPFDREMEQFIVHAAGAGESSDKSTVDPDTAAKLAALGYVSGSGSAAPPPTGVDPKDKVAIANALHDARQQ